MALRKCRECGRVVSSKADKCPGCGAPIPSLALKIVSSVIFFLIIFGGGIAVMEVQDARLRPSAPSRPQTREERIQKGFSTWDGSHKALVKIVKKSMNDPDSFQHADTVFDDRRDYLLVKMTFRGKNAFGGVVTNWIKAKADLNGNVTEVIDQGP